LSCAERRIERSVRISAATGLAPREVPPCVLRCSCARVANADDCDDTTADVNPVATEVCDSIDNDDSDIDDDDSFFTGGSTYWRDADGDLAGDPYSSTYACEQPGGYVNNDFDCDDSSSRVLCP
jgi:hypothetical protein